MNNQRWMLGLAAGCAVGLGTAPRVWADVSDADFKKRLATIGSYSRAMTPEQALAFVEKEQQTWGPVLQKASKQ